MTHPIENRNWSDFYAAVKDVPARPTLIKALELFHLDDPPKLTGRAADVGAGSGVDTLPLLQLGWSVVAIDSSEDGLFRIAQSASAEHTGRLTVVQARFEEMFLPQVDLVNASFSLPFCSPEQYANMFNRVRDAIVPGGRFAGQFFGPRDTWANTKTMTFHTRQEVLDLFAGFDIEHMIERDEDGTTALGDSKHWHTFSVVARKR